jgi:hypothetical protein
MTTYSIIIACVISVMLTIGAGFLFVALIDRLLGQDWEIPDFIGDDDE